MLANQELNSKGLFLSSQKEKKIKHFHVVVVERWQRNVEKSVLHCKVVVLLNKSIVLFAVLFAASSSLLKPPNVAWETVSKAFVRSKLTAEVVMPN